MEPTVRNVFMEEAQLLLPENMRTTPLHSIPPQADPIYTEIFTYYQSNVGRAMEEAIMRSYMRMTTTTSLFKALQCNSCGVQPDSVASYVRFASIVSCGTSLELGISELDFLLNPKQGLQMRSAYGRVDIVTPLVWLDNAPEKYTQYFLPPASTQAKNLNKHITPSEFFGKQNDKGVQTGALPTLDPRTFFPLQGNDWSHFFEKYCDNPLYKVYVRIVVSANGFSEPVSKAVWDYNQSAHGLFQPIILYNAKVQNFGELSQILGKSKSQGSKSSQTAWKDFNDFAIPQQGVPVHAYQEEILPLFSPFTRKKDTKN